MRTDKVAGCEQAWQQDLQLARFPVESSKDADVAQLVEQLIRNQQVNGSSPFVGSSVFAVPGDSRDFLLLQRQFWWQLEIQEPW